MESSRIHSEENDITLNSKTGIVKAVLKSGKSVELPATGFSMFPTLRPDDRVTVRPTGAGEVPEPGNVVVFEYNDVLVMHRLIKIITNNSGEQLFITRGDSGIEQDKEWSLQCLVGIVLAFKRNDKVYPVRIYIPSTWRYRFNCRMLWFYNWLKYQTS